MAETGWKQVDHEEVNAKEYPSNTLKEKREETQRDMKNLEETAVVVDPPKIRKVAKEDIVVKKPTFFGSLWKDIKEGFSYMTTEVLIPAAKNLLVDGIVSFSRKAILGDGYRGSSGRRYYDDYDDRRYRDYGSYFGSGFIDRRDRGERAYLGTRELPELLFRRREAAANVLEDAKEAISKYGVITVSNVYDAAGVSVDYTYEKWGWTDEPGRDLAPARIVACRDGYLLELPKPIKIDNR